MQFQANISTPDYSIAFYRLGVEFGYNHVGVRPGLILSYGYMFDCAESGYSLFNGVMG